MNVFLNDLNALGVVLSQEQTEQFMQYYEMLTEWNERMNLTAITEYADVMKKHFVDSLSIVKVKEFASVTSLIDVGTGAGFPGLALKIAFPDIHVILLDSLHKRILFLNAVIEKLGLAGVEAIHGRAEDSARSYKLRERFDLSVSRAVANLSTLSEYCLPFVKKGGIFVAYKSGEVRQEAEAAGRAFSLLGGDLMDNLEFTLPYSDIKRSFLVVRKVKTTPEKYPRRSGLPGKEPL